MAEPIADILVELLALGELPPDEAAAVRARLSEDDDPRLQAIAASNEEILARHPVEVIAPRLRAAAFETGDASVIPLVIAPAHRRRWVVGAITTAAAIAIVWLLVDRAPKVDGDDGPDVVARAGEGVGATDATDEYPGGQVRHKGVARLLVHVQGGAQPLSEDDTVRAGETLQLSYATGSQPYGVIVSLDGAGVATLHWPSRPDETTKLSPGLVSLDHAYELDDAPKFERFFFVTSERPIDPARILDATRALGRTSRAPTGDLALSEGMSQVSLRLRKGD